jgi:hypothetical protein
METRHYRYPASIQNLKACIKLFFLLSLFISGIGILTYKSANHNDQTGYYYLLLAIPLAIFMAVSILGYYPDIRVDNNGLYVEFLWTYLPVPWKDIVEIKHFKFFFLEWWLIITTQNRLTFFHRLYSVNVLKSFLPGFYIHHKASKDQSDLLKLIRGQVKSKSKAIKSS